MGLVRPALTLKEAIRPLEMNQLEGGAKRNAQTMESGEWGVRQQKLYITIDITAIEQARKAWLVIADLFWFATWFTTSDKYVDVCILSLSESRSNSLDELLSGGEGMGV